MDIHFETQKGESFMIEIGYFDSVLEIKEKVEKYRKIPISKQTLVFNGKILEDSGNVESCVILHNSRMRLIVAPNEEKPKSPEKLKLKQEDDHQFFQSFSPMIHNNNNNNNLHHNVSKKTKIVLRLPASRPSNIYQKLVIDVDLNDSVEQLKKKVHQIEGYPVHQQALFLNKSIELQDQRRLREYELKDGCEIEVFIRPILTPKHPGMANRKSATNAKKLKVIVLAKCGTKKLVVEVNPLDKVQVLRNELDKRHQSADFQLPSEGYFFIYKQNVMDDKETFQWHNVRQGDTIEIFNGSVSGGQ